MRSPYSFVGTYCIFCVLLLRCAAQVSVCEPPERLTECDPDSEKIYLDPSSVVDDAWVSSGIYGSSAHRSLPFERTVYLADGRPVKVEVKSFGACFPGYFGIAKGFQNGEWGNPDWQQYDCGPDARDCLVMTTIPAAYDDTDFGPSFEKIPTIASPEVWSYPEPGPGRCTAERAPAGSGADYRLKDFGAVILDISDFSCPALMPFTMAHKEVDGPRHGNPLDPTERLWIQDENIVDMAFMFGIDSKGQVVHPTIRSGGGGHAIKMGEIEAEEGAALGIDMSNGPVVIAGAEWVGNYDHDPILWRELSVGLQAMHWHGITDDYSWEGVVFYDFPGGDIAKIVTVVAEPYSECVWGGEPINPLDEDNNNFDLTLRKGCPVNPTVSIYWPFSPKYTTPIGCSKKCRQEYKPINTIMQVIDGSEGKCAPDVRATVGYVADPSASKDCCQRYNCNWFQTGPMDSSGEAPCDNKVELRLYPSDL